MKKVVKRSDRAAAKRNVPASMSVTPALPDGAILLSDLRTLIQSSRQRLAIAINATYAYLCWQVGRRLLRENLQARRAAYGKQILATVSQELTAEFGPGFNYTALTRMARFAEWMADEQILATLSQTLSWSHFVELLPIKDTLARDSTPRCAASSAGMCARCGGRSAACCTSAPRCRRDRKESSRPRSPSYATGT